MIITVSKTNAFSLNIDPLNNHQINYSGIENNNPIGLDVCDKVMCFRVKFININEKISIFVLFLQSSSFSLKIFSIYTGFNIESGNDRDPNEAQKVKRFS